MNWAGGFELQGPTNQMGRTNFQRHVPIDRPTEKVGCPLFFDQAELVCMQQPQCPNRLRLGSGMRTNSLKTVRGLPEGEREMFRSKI